MFTFQLLILIQNTRLVWIDFQQTVRHSDGFRTANTALKLTDLDIHLFYLRFKCYPRKLLPEYLDEFHFVWFEKIKDQRNLAAMMTQFPISITLN